MTPKNYHSTDKNKQERNFCIMDGNNNSNELRWFEIRDLLRDFQNEKDWHYLVKRNYSISKVTRLFKEIYDLDIVRVDKGYKGYRYIPYIAYRIRNNQGRYITPEVTLQSLGDFLVINDDYDNL